MSDLTSREERVSTLFHGLNSIEESIQHVIGEIPTMSDEEVEECIIFAASIEKAGFIIRGAAVCEAVKRAERLVGGRGKRDSTGTGVGSCISRLAAKMGKSAKLLETDARIYREFGGFLIHDSDPLSREMYAIALGAGDKAHEAIDLAHVKRDDPGYTTRRFRCDVQQLMAGADAVDLEDVYWLNVPVKPEVREALRYLSDQWSTGFGDTVSRTILASAESLLRDRLKGG